MIFEIETTHDMHEEVYFFINGKIEKSNIEQILVNQSHILENPFKKDSNVRYDYSVKYKVSGYLLPFADDKLFKTKHELITQKP